MDLWALFQRTPERQIERLRKKVKEPHGDPSVRQNAAQRLYEMGTEPALRALLDRYTISVSPSVQDEQEKNQVHHWIVVLGKKAIPPLMDYLKSERLVYWPAKALQDILEPNEQAEQFQFLLEYLWKNPPASAIPKTQLLRALGELHSPGLQETVSEYLGDEDDDVRLAAIQYLMDRPEEEAREAVLECFLGSEDRPRVRNQILEFFMEKGWSVRGFRPAVEESLPEGLILTRDGKVKRVGN